MLKQDGSVWVSGYNLYGQLGIGSKRNTRPDFTLAISNSVKTVAAGGGHTLVVKQDGSLWATGRNKQGQLGTGSRTDSKRFVKVVSSGVKGAAAGAKAATATAASGTGRDRGALADAKAESTVPPASDAVAGVRSPSAVVPVSLGLPPTAEAEEDDGTPSAFATPLTTTSVTMSSSTMS